MTNEAIIFGERIKLAEAGVIGYTGNEIAVVNAAGEQFVIAEPEELHTFAVWKKMGFVVKKGEKAIAQFPIWNYSQKKVLDEDKKPVLDEDGNEMVKSSMYMKVAAFFTASQVEKFTKKEVTK